VCQSLFPASYHHIQTQLIGFPDFDQLTEGATIQVFLLDFYVPLHATSSSVRSDNPPNQVAKVALSIDIIALALFELVAVHALLVPSRLLFSLSGQVVSVERTARNSIGRFYSITHVIYRTTSSRPSKLSLTSFVTITQGS
jgi:hypothetical protein